jgi:hypothetical protein
MTTPPPTDTPIDPTTLDWRPTVDDVATLIRARTKDAQMNEVGTFNSDTRPTDVEVEGFITNGCAKIAARVGWDIPSDGWLEGSHLVALFAACEIELSYWPEQARSNRSAYAEMWAQFVANIGPYADYCAQLSPTGIRAQSGSMYTPSATTVFAYQWGIMGLPPWIATLGSIGHY